MGPKSRFFEKKILKYCPDQNLTKGKIVLELLKYAKSAIKNFDQSENPLLGPIPPIFFNEPL